MKVIILAGGKGTRLPKSAKNIPKPLVKIAGEPILQHQIDLLEKHGLTDIRLSLGYKADQIIDYLQRRGDIFLKTFRRPERPWSPDFSREERGRGRRESELGGRANESLKTYPRAKISIEYIIEPEPLGTGGAIKFASKDLKNDFMVLNGDILTDINLSEFISKYQYNNNVSRETLGAISLFFCEDASDYGLVKVKNERIINFLEKPDHKCSGYVNTGFYILSPKIFENVSRETFSIERNIFPVLSQKRHLIAYIHKGFWTDLGTEKRLWRAQRKLFKNI